MSIKKNILKLVPFFKELLTFKLFKAEFLSLHYLLWLLSYCIINISSCHQIIRLWRVQISTVFQYCCVDKSINCVVQCQLFIVHRSNAKGHSKIAVLQTIKMLFSKIVRSGLSRYNSSRVPRRTKSIQEAQTRYFSAAYDGGQAEHIAVSTNC